MNRLPRIALILGILTALFCVLLVTNWLPWLRGDVPWLPGDSGWRWPYELPRWLWIVPCLLGVAIYTAGAIHLLDREEKSRKYPTRLILWAFVGAALLPILLMTLEQRPFFLLFTRTASDVTGGYEYASTLVTNLNDTLRHWTDFLLRYKEQAPTGGIALSPPGLIVVYYSASRFFDSIPFLADTFGGLLRPLECQNLSMMTWTNGQFASAWLQIFMPLWSALAVAPLYRLGTYIFDRRVASRAVLLFPLIPGLVLFSPRFNTFYVLLGLVMLVTLWRGLISGRRRWIVVAGFIMSMATFINLSLIPLGLLAGLLIIGQWGTGGLQRSRVGSLLLNLALYGIGTASMWLIYSVLSGVSIIDVYRLSLSIHFIINRPYWPWLFMHTYDTFLFIGVPVAGLAIIRIFVARKWSAANVFAVASGLALLIMVLSGTARGETGRVWLFFAPCWLLLGVDLMGRLTNRHVRAMFVLEAACLLCMAAVLRVNFTALTVPTTLPATDQPATYPVNAQFIQGTDRLTLVGLSLDRSPQEVRLYLHWRAESYIAGPYTFSLVRVPPDKQPMDSLTWEPSGWDNPYPPSCWLPHQEFVDEVTVPLGSDFKPGDWQFSLSILDVYTHKPMTVITPDGASSTQVGIGPVAIAAQ